VAFDILLVFKLHNAHPPKPTQQQHIHDSYSSRKKHKKQTNKKSMPSVIEIATHNNKHCGT
jgi:hypothetical protein